MSKVMLFSTSTCSWCRRAKRYFRERRVPFKGITSTFGITTQRPAGKFYRAVRVGYHL